MGRKLDSPVIFLQCYTIKKPKTQKIQPLESEFWGNSKQEQPFWGGVSSPRAAGEEKIPPKGSVFLGLGLE